MSDRLNVPSGSPLEPIIGFGRAVRVGRSVVVAGTAPMDAQGDTLGEGDVYAQMKRCIEIAAEALAAAGASLSDATRTRIMLTDISTWREAARAHGEAFANIRPACTVVEVKGFVDPRWLVELERDATLPEDKTG